MNAQYDDGTSAEREEKSIPEIALESIGCWALQARRDQVQDRVRIELHYLFGVSLKISH